MIGMKVKPSLKRFLTGMPYRFTPSEEDVRISGVIIKADRDTGEAISIERFKEDFDINNVPKLQKEENGDPDNGGEAEV